MFGIGGLTKALQGALIALGVLLFLSIVVQTVLLIRVSSILTQTMELIAQEQGIERHMKGELRADFEVLLRPVSGHEDTGRDARRPSQEINEVPGLPDRSNEITERDSSGS